MTATHYGPTALATPANFVTVARILATPVFVLLIATQEPSWLTFAVGFAIGMSDFVDGARGRQGATRSGAFLDPLADKVLVLGGMFALVANEQFHWLPVAIISRLESWRLVLPLPSWPSRYFGAGDQDGEMEDLCATVGHRVRRHSADCGIGSLVGHSDAVDSCALDGQTGIAYLAGARRIAKAQLGKDV